MFRFSILGSGSKGNSLLVESARTRILVDCGFSLVELGRRLAAVGAAGPETLDAVVVTHSHGDHVGGLGVLTRRHGTPIYVTPGSRKWIEKRLHGPVESFLPGSSFRVGDLDFRSFALTHDAPDTVALRIENAGVAMAICTDLGEVRADLAGGLAGCHTLLMESNHDEAMLWDGPYPMRLKKRVASRYGHLSNAQSHDLLRSVLPSGVKRVFLSHLSETNNSPEKAMAAMEPLRRAHPQTEWRISPQRVPTPFIPLAGAGQLTLF